ncbi:MAG TPA: 3-hydroxyacyl-CoA dehydrogenase NAD-binding domain-containing protein [Vicinamibacteria bacterium]|mgnify:CR=1 FL=1|nr:3-hydroxyacyl-CoA dehydrogenase NAD-binding domain-containing protein [Vicinamibacteria bacterium]
MTGMLTTRRRDDGVFVVSLDVPGEKLNVLSLGLLDEFEAVFKTIDADAKARGVVIISGKPEGFIAGADIKQFVAVTTAQEAIALAGKGHDLLNRIEGSKIPFVAAINGICLGGGTELSLACAGRVASDDPKTAIGLPEVQLGLVPGMGGTQRLPRLVGLALGLDMILSARNLKATKALRAGLVDEVVPRSILEDRAAALALSIAAGKTPVRPGIKLVEKLARPIIFSKARSTVMAKTGGHYPAPLRAIEVIKDGTATSLAAGLEIEKQAFGELLVGEVSRALVNVFFATQDIKKAVPLPDPPPEISKVCILGAGLMGAGIAGIAADSGMRARMKDRDDASVSKGLAYVRGIWEERRKRGSLNAREVSQKMDRVSVATDYSGFRQAELIIEAVFEDLNVKRQVLRETEEVTSDTCVFASNTSSLPITDIALNAKRKDLVLGMHFFSPVHKMPLLEIIETKDTARRATEVAVAFGRRIGKHVIVVGDGPGFFTTRALSPYMNEAAHLLEEGVAVEAIDKAMKDFGFPVGPITLLDEVGIDVGAKVQKILHHAFGARMDPPPSMAKLIADGRLGRKNAKGFYRYAEGSKAKEVDSTVYALMPAGAGQKAMDPKIIQERLFHAFLNESAYCLQEGILRKPVDGDIGAIFGLGFPPWWGGPFRAIDKLGAKTVLETLKRLQGQHGARFDPAPILGEYASSGRRFY